MYDKNGYFNYLWIPFIVLIVTVFLDFILQAIAFSVNSTMLTIIQENLFFLVFFLKRFQFSLWPQALLLGNLASSFLAWGQVFKGGSLGGIFWWLGERSFNLATPGITLAQVGDHLLLRPYATFSHPNSLAGFLLVSLLLLWGARESFKNKGFFKLALLFLGLTLFLTFSFAAYLGAGLALIIFLWQKWRQKSNLLPKIGVGAGLLLYIIVISLSIKAGLVENDIILEVNCEKIDQDYPLMKAIAKFKPGDEITLKVLHKGEEKEVKVRLEELKE